MMAMSLSVRNLVIALSGTVVGAFAGGMLGLYGTELMPQPPVDGDWQLKQAGVAIVSAAVVMGAAAGAGLALRLAGDAAALRTGLLLAVLLPAALFSVFLALPAAAGFWGHGLALLLAGVVAYAVAARSKGR